MPTKPESKAVTNEWIPLMDYAVKNSISLSTLRRHIKANKITYRVENGKYLILDELNQTVAGPAATAGITGRIEQLELDLNKAQEEIAELKMLVAIYEEKIAKTPNH
ncbi:MAG: hypothetical protein JNL01_09200 [Bdellovibrionales bacterium]|nr:hypothetical protein [Bdellovibrionales bacterium]